jgi:ribonuclease VapC
MIIDTSVVLALLFDEPRSAEAADFLAQHSAELYMSSVNVAETFMKLNGLVEASKRTKAINAFKKIPLTTVVVDFAHAEIAAIAREDYSKLNFGDCFAYAAAKILKMPLLTFDNDFKGVDVKVVGLS